MTDAQYERWLSDLDARRVLLAELTHSEGVEYVATSPFISLPTDSDPNRVYDDCLDAAVDISTRIDGLIGFGEVSLLDDGSLSSWVAKKWQGHPIKLFLGDPDWPRDDFRILASGINGGITDAQRGSLAFAMNDLSSQLDEVIDTGQLPDDAGPVPLALGSVFNAPAFLLTPDPYEFKASYLPCTALTPKDNGNPVGHVDNLSTGSFVLSNALVGTLTVDIEESHNTPQLIAEWVAAQYGITVSDIDLPAYTVGLYYSGQVSGSQILEELCEGLGAYWYLNALGELIVRQHTAPGAAEITLVNDEIVQDQISLAGTEQPWSSLTLRWRRNYSTLSTVAAALPASQSARLSREWNESIASQSTTGYPLAEKITRNSCIQNATDAATERDRLLNLHSIRRDLYRIEAFLPPVTVGISIAVDHPRLQGRTGRLIAVSRSPTRSVTDLEVWL